MEPRQLHLLIVDDSAGDRLLIKHAFEGAGLDIALYEVGDGEEALSFLKQEPPFQDVPHPDLVMLDLNLPKLDGRDVLRFIKSSPTHVRIPVIMFSSSESPSDILESYESHASTYITKPLDMSQLTELCDRIKQYWLESAKLPPRWE